MSQQNLNLRQSTAVLCEECGNHTFQPAYFIRKISKFLSPDGEEQIIPIDTLICTKCGHVNDDYNTHGKLEEEINKSK